MVRRRNPAIFGTRPHPFADRSAVRLRSVLPTGFAQLYRHEHELLRELADVDSALDVYDRRSEVCG